MLLTVPVLQISAAVLQVLEGDLAATQAEWATPLTTEPEYPEA